MLTSIRSGHCRVKLPFKDLHAVPWFPTVFSELELLSTPSSSHTLCLYHLGTPPPCMLSRLLTLLIIIIIVSSIVILISNHHYPHPHSHRPLTLPQCRVSCELVDCVSDRFSEHLSAPVSEQPKTLFPYIPPPHLASLHEKHFATVQLDPASLTGQPASVRRVSRSKTRLEHDEQQLSTLPDSARVDNAAEDNAVEDIGVSSDDEV